MAMPPPLLPLLLLAGTAGAEFLGGGRCYSTLPPPQQYCKPNSTCSATNTTCPSCGAHFPPGCPCPNSTTPFVPPPLPLKSFLSRTLGSNMVLQRAPQQATVWGFAHAGTTVTVTMDSHAPLTATADAAGVWRQLLPATEGSTTTTHNVTFKGSGGEEAHMDNVLFGDVYLCGGRERDCLLLELPTQCSRVSLTLLAHASRSRCSIVTRLTSLVMTCAAGRREQHADAAGLRRERYSGDPAWRPVPAHPAVRGLARQLLNRAFR